MTNATNLEDLELYVSEGMIQDLLSTLDYYIDEYYKNKPEVQYKELERVKKCLTLFHESWRRLRLLADDNKKQIDDYYSSMKKSEGVSQLLEESNSEHKYTINQLEKVITQLSQHIVYLSNKPKS